ncbi:hypothetical protein NDU88_002128 [Pleurodeles waltl]|uniref:Uncharacterized protein n=1 Tax=Pleurodeles waltl TaxID=8319 RepID=A0AAV7KRD6_PLEWA|nr:hypothetical protein NDU88_002128 [Pleurodeles waltl]
MKGGEETGGGGRGKQSRPAASLPVAGHSALPDPPLTDARRSADRPGVGGGNGPSGVRALVVHNQGAQEGQILLSRRYPVSSAGEPRSAPVPPRFSCLGCAVSGNSRFLACSGAAGLRAGCPVRSLLNVPCGAFPAPLLPSLQPRQGGTVTRVRAHPASSRTLQAL